MVINRTFAIPEFVLQQGLRGGVMLDVGETGFHGAHANRWRDARGMTDPL